MFNVASDFQDVAQIDNLLTTDNHYGDGCELKYLVDTSYESAE